MTGGGVVLPTSVATSASTWQQVDWLQLRYESPPAAAGLATIEAPQLEPDEMWLLDHMVASSTSTIRSQMRLYENGLLLDGTGSGNFDVADWPAGLLIRPSTSLIARWSGVSDGAVSSLTVQARQMRRF
jgi:hypothetical protein